MFSSLRLQQNNTTMKFNNIATIAALSIAALSAPLLAEDKEATDSVITWTSGGTPSEGMDVLFVQNATGVSLKDGKLVLKGINPSTICFTDRPARLAGHMTTTAFIPLWSSGKDSFLKDSPNANLSILNGEKVTDVVVEISNPVLSGTTLTYDAKVLEGDDAVEGGACSLFIDVIGMPRTPVSYAGVARRSIRRGVRLR
jgi:hypothetical protein